MPSAINLPKYRSFARIVAFLDTAVQVILVVLGVTFAVLELLREEGHSRPWYLWFLYTFGILCLALHLFADYKLFLSTNAERPAKDALDMATFWVAVNFILFVFSVAVFISRAQWIQLGINIIVRCGFMYFVSLFTWDLYATILINKPVPVTNNNAMGAGRIQARRE